MILRPMILPFQYFSSNFVRISDLAMVVGSVVVVLVLALKAVFRLHPGLICLLSLLIVSVLVLSCSLRYWGLDRVAYRDGG
jgi:uncharacterized membrane protein YesL